MGAGVKLYEGPKSRVKRILTLLYSIYLTIVS